MDQKMLPKTETVVPADRPLDRTAARAREEGLPVSGVCFSDLELENLDLSGTDFQCVVFENCRFTGCVF